MKDVHIDDAQTTYAVIEAMGHYESAFVYKLSTYENLCKCLPKELYERRNLVGYTGFWG